MLSDSISGSSEVVAILIWFFFPITNSTLLSVLQMQTLLMVQQKKAPEAWCSLINIQWIFLVSRSLTYLFHATLFDSDIASQSFVICVIGFFCPSAAIKCDSRRDFSIYICDDIYTASLFLHISFRLFLRFSIIFLLFSFFVLESNQLFCLCENLWKCVKRQPRSI